MYQLPLLQSVAAVLVLYALGRFILKRARPPLPPGPKALPLVGNVTDLPPKDAAEWQHWLSHKSLYGPISSITVMGQTMIILNDHAAAIELLEKRAVKHSNRLYMKFAMDMCGFDELPAFMPNEEPLRRIRRLMNSQIGSSVALAKFNNVQETEVGRFLLRTLDDPKNLLQHIKTEAGAIILHLTYGYTVEPKKRDPMVVLAERMMTNFSDAAMPGAWIVDFVPFMAYLPQWLPGMGFKQIARQWRKVNEDFADKPYDFVRGQMAAGNKKSSFIGNMIDDHLRKGSMSARDEHGIKYAGASIYAGGSDTSVSSVMSFFLAMTMHPEIQRKAWEEIDHVVGSSRLPTFHDRKKLLYVEAIMKETFRWHAVAPLGLPHVTTQDDIYNGYLIPKGAILLPNIQGFMRDPTVYHDPEVFMPERFLAPHNEPSPDAIFGFGRRVCPGKRMAEASVWLIIAQSLSSLDIHPAVYEDGRAVPVIAEYAPGIITHPKPWDFEITARSEHHAELIKRVELDHPWVESDSKQIPGLEKYSV